MKWKKNELETEKVQPPSNHSTVHNLKKKKIWFFFEYKKKLETEILKRKSEVGNLK